MFTWLLIGHLIGDWLLQNDWMARGKKRGLFNFAGFVHYTVYTSAVLGTVWLNRAEVRSLHIYWAAGALIFGSHWLIDGTRLVERWMYLFKQSHSKVVRLMVDQTLHLLVLAIVSTQL